MTVKHKQPVTLREIRIAHLCLQKLLDRYAANWMNLPVPFEGMTKKEWHERLERMMHDCDFRPPMTCGNCGASFEPSLEYLEYGTRNNREGFWSLSRNVFMQVERAEFLEWPTCSEECRDFLIRRVGRQQKRRISEWETLKECRRLLKETRKLLREPHDRAALP